MNVLENDPRYLLLAVPSDLINAEMAVEDIVELMFLESELFTDEEYFIIPPDQDGLYQQAYEMATRLCVSRGFSCERVDGSNVVIRVHAGEESNDHHLRLVFVDKEAGVELGALH